jgi:glycosyltransferase involved in cell wall biosynthesis/predicted O-methyltransferase YrrM
LPPEALQVAVTDRGSPAGPYWRPFEGAELRRLMGPDREYYEAEIRTPAPPPPPPQPQPRPVPDIRESAVVCPSPRPLVSCIMPTHNRRCFIPRAVEYFLRQDYEPKELLVVDDGSDAIGDLLPADPRLRYVRLHEKRTVGEKRNLACEQARGEIIVHWDDDDWQAPRRIRAQVDCLLQHGADLCGLNPVLFYDPRSNQAWRYLYPPECGPWVHGSSFCYRRAFWESRRFAAVDVGEDNQFVWGAPAGSVASLPDPTCLVCLIHDDNVSPKSPGGAYWEPYPAEEVGRLFGSNEPVPGRRATISCITVTYNPRGDWLERAIASARLVDEHIIVDDGSDIPVPQATVRIPHRGITTARNIAVSLATGEWIAPLDDDDYWDESVREMIRYSQYTAADVVWAPVEQFGLAEGIWGDRCDFSTLVKKNQLSAGSWFRKSVWRRLGGYQHEGVEDWDFWARAYKKGMRFEYLPVPYYHHQIREGSFWWRLSPETLRVQREVERNVELAEGPPSVLTDSLGRVDVALPLRPLRAPRCIATAVSPGYDELLDELLGSLRLYGGCPDALLAVFAIDPDPACLRVAARHGAEVIRCAARAPMTVAVKSVLYSVPHAIDAEQFLCLDADMLVLDELGPVFEAIGRSPAGSVLACRDSHASANSLADALGGIYSGRRDDFERILGRVGAEPSYPLVVNDGLFAGSRAALLAVDRAIRGWPQAAAWLEEGVAWRNQFLFNLALAHLDCGVELDGTYNVQLLHDDAAVSRADGRCRAVSNGRPARVLHFNGWARRKLPELRGAFSLPAVDSGRGGGYDAFLAALKGWIGRHGFAAMTWSFYGAADGEGAIPRDSEAFPLLALLHYLIRANGCIRVLETGTARGVSTACIASALAHRAGGRVVTLDTQVFPARQDLWAALPPAMRHCIEPRQVDCLEGMAAAYAAGECFQAALLDTVHTAGHVWQEFQWATRLVCPGGLILVHDVRWAGGTVEGALRRIQSEGYGVARLWTAEAGEQEDDHLGLAVIENRRQSNETAKSE